MVFTVLFCVISCMYKILNCEDSNRTITVDLPTPGCTPVGLTRGFATCPTEGMAASHVESSSWFRTKSHRVQLGPPCTFLRVKVAFSLSREGEPQTLRSHSVHLPIFLLGVEVETLRLCRLFALVFCQFRVILLSFTAVNIKTAEIYRASFQDRGPEEQLRAARTLAGGPMISIYDAETEQLRIGPYSWTPFPHVDFWLQQDDKQILENLSTSPLAEPPHFVEHIRSTLMFLKKYPSPTNTLFPGNKALLYKKNEDGLWEKISSPGS
uniref:N-terminal asparagine amidase n=1 Tax=Theropithecus gelada TaxID=9565 RepID=A0A8D2G788_THEGE